MKLLSLFSGIGAFEKALANIGVDYKLVGFSEIDKWAIESYCAIHGVEKELNLGAVLVKTSVWQGIKKVEIRVVVLGQV